MLDDVHLAESKDASYVALRGYLNRITVNVRVDSIDIDDIWRFRRALTPEQRIAFVRHNLDAIRVIAEKKLKCGDGEQEDWHGRAAIGVRVRSADFDVYLNDENNRLSYVGFDPRARAKWVGHNGYL
jgi:hypothetical protein